MRATAPKAPSQSTHHTGPEPSARPGREGAALACYLARNGDPRSRGYKYDILFEDKILVTSYDPEFAAARALRDLGYSGELRFFRPGNPEPALVMKNLVKAAGYCATPDGRFRKFEPFDNVRKLFPRETTP